MYSDILTEREIKAWNDMSVEQRLEIYQKIEIREAGAIGRRPAQIMSFNETPETEGKYNPESNVISLNDNHFRESGTVVITYHDFRHEQDHALNAFKWKNPKLCRDLKEAMSLEENWQAYPSNSEEYSIYANCRLEGEAEKNAYNQTIELFSRLDPNNPEFIKYMEDYEKRRKEIVEKAEREFGPFYSKRIDLIIHDRYRKKLAEKEHRLNSQNKIMDNQIRNTIKKIEQQVKSEYIEKYHPQLKKEEEEISNRLSEVSQKKVSLEDVNEPQLREAESKLLDAEFNNLWKQRDDLERTKKEIFETKEAQDFINENVNKLMESNGTLEKIKALREKQQKNTEEINRLRTQKTLTPNLGISPEYIEAYNQQKEQERIELDNIDKARKIIEATKEEVINEMFKKEKEAIKKQEMIVEGLKKDLPQIKKIFGRTELDIEHEKNYNQANEKLSGMRKDLEEHIKINRREIKVNVKKAINSDSEKYKELMGLSDAIRDARIRQRDFDNKMQALDPAYNITQQRRMANGGMVH